MKAMVSLGVAAGGLVLAGGTLRFAGAFDPSTRTISILAGGGTFDTNGNNITLANTLGSGSGAFTKTGTGNLTLNASTTLTGGTNVTAGTLTLGASSAIGTGPLVLSNAAILDMGANSATVASLSFVAGSVINLTGSGTLTVNGPATVSQGTIDAVLAGSMRLVKSVAKQSLTLGNELNSFTGSVWIQDGTINVTSLANAGLVSSLGAASGDNAAILMGNGASTNATLAFASAVNSSTDRFILLAGSTGGATIDSGSLGGLLTLSGGAFGFAGGAKTLTLQGGNGTSASPNVFSGTIVNGVATIALTKAGLGTWSLTGANTYTGATTVNVGLLLVDFANATPATDVISASSALTLGGGTLGVVGKSSTVNSQTFASIALTAGTFGAVSADRNGATSLAVDLKALTRGANSGVDFELLNGATIGVTGLSTNNVIITRSGTLLGSNWGGTTNQFWSDANVWFDARIGSDAAKYQFSGKPWAAWQARGLDPHSVIADPLLVDEKRPELGLRKKSPAFKLGYRQIDLSTLGPRKPAQRK